MAQSPPSSIFQAVGLVGDILFEPVVMAVSGDPCRGSAKGLHRWWPTWLVTAPEFGRHRRTTFRPRTTGIRWRVVRQSPGDPRRVGPQSATGWPWSAFSTCRACHLHMNTMREHVIELVPDWCRPVRGTRERTEPIPVSARAGQRFNIFLVACIGVQAMAAIAGQIELGQPSMSALSAPPSGPAPDGGSAVAPRFLEEQSRFQAFLDIQLAPVEELGSPARPGLRRIGVGRSIPEPYRGDVAESLVWTTNGDGDLVTTFQITSPDAKALRVAILATLPVNATLRFHAVAAEGAGNPPSRQYTAADFQLQVSESATSREPMVIERPAYAHQVVNDRPTVWSPIMRGDAVGVEVVLPLGTSIPDFSLAVVGVSHLYTLPTDALSRADAARACQPIDAMCSRAPRCTLDAALRLTYTTTQGESYSCSATAINDSRSMEEKLAAPSVLTAHHCISAAYDVETVVGNWHQRTTDCDSGTTTNRYVELRSGADLIATHAESDHTLLRMRDPVPTAGGYCLAAWSTADDLVGRAVTSIHHGASGFKEWPKVTSRKRSISPLTTARLCMAIS